MMYCNTFPDLQEKLLNSNHSNFISTVEAGWCQWKSWMPKQNAWTQKRQRERESHISVRGYICSDLSITVYLNSKLGRFQSRNSVSSCFHNTKHTTGGYETPQTLNNIKIKSFALNFPSKQSTDKANMHSARKKSSQSALMCQTYADPKQIFIRECDRRFGCSAIYQERQYFWQTPPVTFLHVLNCKQEAGWNPDEKSSTVPIKQPASHASTCPCVRLFWLRTGEMDSSISFVFNTNLSSVLPLFITGELAHQSVRSLAGKIMDNFRLSPRVQRQKTQWERVEMGAMILSNTRTRG